MPTFDDIDGSQVIFWVIFLYFAFVFLTGIKIANEGERFAVFLLGRFHKLAGPGLVFKVAAVQTFHRIRLGAVGSVVSENMARFEDTDIPIAHVANLGIGTRVKVTDFEEAALVVVPTAELAVNRCPRCGHEF